jgi:hypothetical protein
MPGAARVPCQVSPVGPNSPGTGPLPLQPTISRFHDVMKRQEAETTRGKLVGRPAIRTDTVLATE